MNSCEKLLSGFMEHLAQRIRLTPGENGCVLHLPLLTADGRRSSVYIDADVDDGVIVHDGGRTAAQLFVQGFHNVEAKFDRAARKLGISTDTGRLLTRASRTDVHEAILLLVQAQLLLTADVLHHEMKLSEQPRTRTRVAQAFEHWRPEGTSVVQKNYRVKGGRGAPFHVFDHVAFRADAAHHTVAVKVIPASQSPKIQAGLYGFMALDIKDTDAGKWPRLAVISRGEKWKDEQLETVRNLSADVLVLSLRDEAKAVEMVRKKVAKLVAA